MNDKNTIVVEKMLEEVLIVQEFMDGVDLESFIADEKLKRAVCMAIINLGELTKNLDDGFRNNHSEIPWRAIAGFRDVAAHKYQTLHMEDVYTTAIYDLPEIKNKLSNILDT